MRGRLLATALFLVLFSSLYTSLASAPAVSDRFRPEVARGAAAPSGYALYDPPLYLRIVAEGLLDAAVTAEDAALAQAASAVQAEALSLAPADPHLWAGASWSALAEGDDANALRALQNSWRFAPYSRDLAGERLLLAEMLGLYGDAPDSRVAADLATLDRYVPIEAEALLGGAGS